MQPAVLRYCLMGVIGAFWSLHWMWLLLARRVPEHWAGGYLRLEPASRAILLVHSAFVLILTLQLIPYTWCAHDCSCNAAS